MLFETDPGVPVGEAAMFVRCDTPTVMDGLVVRYTLNPERWRNYNGQINASREGVGLSGIWPIMPPDMVVVVEEQLIRARIVALDLRRQYDLIGFGAGRVEPPSEAHIDQTIARAVLPPYEETPRADDEPAH